MTGLQSSAESTLIYSARQPTEVSGDGVGCWSVANRLLFLFRSFHLSGGSGINCYKIAAECNVPL